MVKITKHKRVFQTTLHIFVASGGNFDSVPLTQNREKIKYFKLNLLLFCRNQKKELFMKTRSSLFIIENMNYSQIESQIIEAIINTYITKNGNEYYLIIDLMRIYTPKYANLVKNALILINSLFFIKSPFVCGSDMQEISSESKKILETVCIME